MSDIAVIAATVETTLREIGKQASALGKGLQDVAPGSTVGVPVSIQYLLDIGEKLNEIAEQCKTTFLASSIAPRQGI